MTHDLSNWTIDDSARLYGIPDWGRGFFGVNAAGEMTVEIEGPNGPVEVSLMEIVAGLEERGYEMPIVLRIENLLQSRIVYLNETFRNAIAAAGYQGRYRGVFPVKVNQQCQIIEEICRFGAPYQHGLEAGSKAELVLALANLTPGGLLVLNGYKDREFIDLGLWAHKLGHPCFFVIESPSELDLLIERSRLLDVRPHIGARIKISTQVSGMWTETSGDRSSFGLSSTQLLAMVETLQTEGMIDCLEMLHCHLGSQIPCLEDIGRGVEEACRYYINLCREGAPMGYLDLGGGLAVDYSGRCSGDGHSRNYSLEDYCRAIVTTITATLDSTGIEHPHIVTESGRATVAYSSMLLFNILDVMHFEAAPLPQPFPASEAEILQEQHRFFTTLNGQDYHQAVILRDRMRQQFRDGQLTLRQRTLGENLFLATAQKVVATARQSGLASPQISELQDALADIYYGNFSVFQSLPDTWAIDQLLPVAPLHRLGQKPTREAILSDLTCDCDGKLDQFIVGGELRKTLPLHPFTLGENYYVGAFLMGAYQETLGDLHNLFGDTHVASVRINEEGGYDLIEEISGDTIGEILSYVEYSPSVLFDRMRKEAELAVREQRLSVAERQQFLTLFGDNLSGYPYYRD